MTLGPREELRRLGVVNLDSIMTIQKSLLTHRIGRRPQAKMDAANHAIKAMGDSPRSAPSLCLACGRE